MSIITISRGSYSKGKEIAEKVAGKLGYECVSRDILIEASEQFNIPEIKLVRALHDAPSVLQRFTYGKERYMAFICMAFLEHVQSDNVVYHGLAGHFFLKGVSHVLKVRVIADMEDRVRLEMEREGISEREARAILKKDDKERRQWSTSLYGSDTADPSLYDIVIHIKKMSVDDAVNIICQCIALPQFQTTEESQRVMDELVLAAQVKAALIRDWPNVQVRAAGSKIMVEVRVPIDQEPAVTNHISEIVRTVRGVASVQVNVRTSMTEAFH